MNYEQLLNYVSEEFSVYEVPLIEQTGSYGFFSNGTILIEETQSEIEKNVFLLKNMDMALKMLGIFLTNRLPKIESKNLWLDVMLMNF